MQRFILVIVFIFIKSFLSAQSKNTTESNQQWFQYYFTGNMSERWSLNADGGYRLRDVFSEKSQFIARAGTMFGLSNSLKIGGGFALLGFYKDHSIGQLEYRPYQEFVLDQIRSRIDLSHRFRVEERFIRTVATENAPSDESFNFRFRYQIQLVVPVVNFKNPHKKLSAILANEVFINAGREIVYNVFDQNRIMAGPLFSISKNIDLTLLYTYQFAAINEPNTYQNTHIYWFRIYHNLDF